jgi:putative ATP-binding cassette transporter
MVTLPIQFLNTYGQQRFALAWRDRTTTTLAGGYLEHHTYYRLEADPERMGGIDNPDQRLADDIQRAVFSATDLFFGFCTSLLSLAAYILVLFGISGALVVTLLIATLFGNGVIVQLVRRVAALSFRQQAFEADFRFALVHIRSNAEGIAFLGGEAHEGRGLAERFQRLLANFEKVIRWRTVVGQSTDLYGFLMQFVPYVVLSTAYFGGAVTLGQLTVGSIAFAQVQTALSFLIVRADDFSSLFASLQRVRELRSVTAATPPEPAPPLPAAIASGAPSLRLLHVSVAHPIGGRPLISDLSLQVSAGERLLIAGPSGCGKTSLLRVICGLAPASAGRIETPGPERLMVLPQKPYMPLGSLREQLLFSLPLTAAPPEDADLRRLLAAVRLGNLSERYPDLSVVDDWGRVLSGGEQQRLGFARLLINRRPFVILDEATSALDLDTERHLYGLLRREGMAVISVGHRPSLREFHPRVLRLDGHGGWALEPAMLGA